MSFHKGLIGKDVGGGSVGFDRIPAVHMPTNVPQSDKTLSADKTLSDYIGRKIRQEAFDQIALEDQARAAEKKLTFDEWWNGERMCSSYRIAREAWEAALTVGKL